MSLSLFTHTLSLGQNNGITTLTLNITHIVTYHLDTISSLDVSSRAKRIDVHEIQNEVVLNLQLPRKSSSLMSGRRPLPPSAHAYGVQTGLVVKEKAPVAAAR
ncbi:hypothetical protein CONLIGDRAFT_685766 [Coniochaeta ligniaria NRRL 30616]|uniref:Uncharacterized protein n=1 Tax=Coniochaeta ligniaria NRRL 30616 TaxID=1408157 RepID=A0A1J7I9K8_9PEZI|nr:hypothetical protein CONLIGDRAFT_685766 [Coniochaeta ligniaria NRRL 30616]